MKALILSGGKGTRLRPLTHTRAKQLIPIANKPTLFYGIESIVAAGITDIGIIVGDTAAEVQAAAGDGTQFGVKITYIKQDHPKGLAHAVATAEKFLGAEPFVMYLGDNILRDGITQFVQSCVDRKPDASILLTPVEHPEWFGNAVLGPDGKVQKLEEKPKQPQSNLALVGVYFFTAKVHEAIAKIKPSPRGELEITDAISQLIKDGYTVDSHRVEGWWKDTGNAEDLISANLLILERLNVFAAEPTDKSVKLEGPIQLGKDVVLKNCRIRGPVVIGDRCRIEDAYVGPFSSVGPDCEIVGCEIENSIVLQHTRLLKVTERIDSSIFGEHSVVQGKRALPRSHRFVVGDQTEIFLSE